MLSFESDYIEGACKEILDALIKTNLDQLLLYADKAGFLSHFLHPKGNPAVKLQNQTRST